jgi:predicted DNA-binding protein (MmcQ/YjbR family)
VTAEEVEACCLALPGAHKVRLWGRVDVYKLTNKVFCTCSEADGVSFKASDILYALLTDSGPGRKARGFTPGAWVAVPLAEADADDVTGWIAQSHGYAAAGLTKAARAELGL